MATERQVLNARRLRRGSTEAIEAADYLVLRFWNNNVLSNTEGVIEEIRRSLLNARA